MTDISGDETLISHIKALRATIIKCLIALGIVLIPAFFLAPYAINFLISIIVKDTTISFNFFSPMEVFILQIKMALVLDILICFPYIAKKIWDFILPALYPHEEKFAKSIVLSSSLLFIIGIIFCLFLILPMVIRFGLSFSTPLIKPTLGIGNIISLSLHLSVVFGIMFQFPLITYGVIRSHISSYSAIASKRPHIFVAILIISGILTPPDVISQLLMTIPTYLLFEAGLFFGKKQ